MTEPTSPQPESDLDKLTKRWNAPWLDNPNNVVNISNEQLKKTVVSIGVRPDGMNEPEILRADYLSLERKVYQDDVIPEDEAIEYLEKLASEFIKRSELAKQLELESTTRSAMLIASAVSSSESLNLPSGEIEQRKYIRMMLDAIEKSGRDCYDYANVQQVRKLEVSLDSMHASVAEEVRVRLSIHDSSQLIKQAAGFIERRDPGYTISSALSEAMRRDHDISNRVAEVFFEDGLPGMKLSEAWDLLEWVNFNYPNAVIEADQQIVHEYCVANKLNTRTESRINEMLLSGNYDGRNIVDKKNNDDSGGLAAKDKKWLIDLLGEDFLNSLHSIYGFELSDAERELGRVPTNYFADSDVSRKNAVTDLLIRKLGGNKAAIDSLRIAEKMSIATLETSVWNKSALSGNDELAEVIGLREYRIRRRVVGRNGGPEIHVKQVQGFGTSWIRLQSDSKIDNSKPFWSKDVNISKITSGSHQVFGPAYANRYQALRNLLMDRAPKPEFNKTFLQNAIPYFNTADPGEKKDGVVQKNGPLKLRTLWVLGVVDMALSHLDVGWGQKDLENFRVAVSVDPLSDNVGTFITPEQWAWVESQTNYQNRVKDLSMKSYWESLSFAQSGKKR